jgi:septum site-determining protein MinD
MENSKVIGVISIKGGVGKTTTTVNLAAALAGLGQKTLVVDANYSAPNLALHLGLVKPEAATIHDVLTGRSNLDKAIYEHDSGFHFIPGTLNPQNAKIDIFSLKKKLKEIKSNYDVILIDSSPTLNNELLSTIIASDQLLVVTSPDYPTLSCTIKAVKVAKQKNTPIAGIVLNKGRGKSFELSTEDIEELAEVPVIAKVNDDIKILEALSEATPSVILNPTSSSSIEYKKLAAALIGQEYEDPRILGKLFNFFHFKKDKHEINRLVMAKGKK